MKDSPLIKHVPVTESFWPQTTRCPLSWMTSQSYQVTKEIGSLAFGVGGKRNHRV